MKVLVVDDDEIMREVLETRLESWGYTTQTAADGHQAERLFADFEPDMVISDVVMPGLSGLDLVKAFKARAPDVAVLLITGHGTVDRAVEAMKQGAHDFLTKPLDYVKLETTLNAIRRDLEARRESSRLKETLAASSRRTGELVGDSEPMRAVRELIEELATSDAPVLITGESGTGKELAARLIHRLSSRAGEELVAINAAAIPSELMESEIFGHEKGAFTGATGVRRGCFELAHRGTLFLDEIAEMPIALQPKLLRVLEDGRVRRLGSARERRFDVRLVSATNRDPRQSIRDGRLREDLFYRLNVFTVQMPTLRERPGDLGLLAQHFIARLNRQHKLEVRGLQAEALHLLERYPWPGNVRELRNVVERGMVLAKSEWIEPSHLPPYIREPDTDTIPHESYLTLPADTTLAEAEKALILKTLEEANNNRTEAARRLGVATKTIYNKLKAYGLD